MGANLKPGESIELTDEWLKDHPEVTYIEYTPAEITRIEIEIEALMAEKAGQPKPKCKETCRSCRKDRDDKIQRLDREVATCKAEHDHDAEVFCQNGIWRGDPRHECGMFESSDYCGTPGAPVPITDEQDCTEDRGPPNHRVTVHVECPEGAWMTACKQSWMNDQPATTTTHTSDGVTVEVPIPRIGTVKHTFGGTDTVTTQTQGGQGYNSACADLSNKYRDKVRNEIYKGCKQRVEAANPGVTCDD